MAIGKLLPVLLCRHAPRVTARPDMRCRKLGHPDGSAISPIRLKISEASSLRRYHSRKRNVKPILIGLSIIRFRANCLRLKSGFWRRRGALGFRRFQPEPAGAALAERLFKLGKDRPQFTRQRPRRID